MKKSVFLGGGDKRDRTADLLNAIQALSQLSYTPIFCSLIDSLCIISTESRFVKTFLSDFSRNFILFSQQNICFPFNMLKKCEKGGYGVQKCDIFVRRRVITEIHFGAKYVQNSTLFFYLGLLFLHPVC